MSDRDGFISGDITATPDRVLPSRLGSPKIGNSSRQREMGFGVLRIKQVSQELSYIQFEFPKKARATARRFGDWQISLKTEQQLRFALAKYAVSKHHGGIGLLTYSGPTVMPPPKLPFQTTNERLMTLGNDIAGAITKLSKKEYSEVIRSLDSVSDAMKGLILSGALPSEILETFDVLLTSLETVTQEIYEHARQSVKLEEKEEIIEFLKGLERTLKAFAQPDVWKEKMVKEWGTP